MNSNLTTMSGNPNINHILQIMENVKLIKKKIA